jgi:hypothetical protein
MADGIAGLIQELLGTLPLQSLPPSALSRRALSCTIWAALDLPRKPNWPNKALGIVAAFRYKSTFRACYEVVPSVVER